MYFQQGGQQAQIMQIIQQYAQMNQIDPKQLMQKLQQMPAEQQKQAIQQMMQTIQQGSAGQQPNMQQAAMAYGGYITGMFAEGGETENGDTNAGMAMGQIAAMHDKLSRLQKFITSPDTEVDPWVASKITLADDYLNSVADYMQYGEQQESENEMPNDNEQGEMMANGGYTVTRSHDRKGKTHKVTGPGGVVKYFGDAKLGQHPNDPARKKAFYARHKKNLANNPFFRAFARKTWQTGGQADYNSILEQNAADAEKYPSAYHKDYVTGYPVVNSASAIQRPGGFDCPPGYTKYSNGDGTFSCRMTNEFPGTKSDLRGLTKVADDIQFYNQGMQRSLAAAPTRKNGGSTFSGNAWYENGGTNNPGFKALPDYVQHQILSNMAYGGIHLDPAKKGTFKAQASRMGMGVQEAASTILNAPEGRYSPAMRKKANFAKNFAKQMGGPVEGDVLDVTPEELQMLKQGGYNFEIID
jgi:hypothetical protein